MNRVDYSFAAHAANPSVQSPILFLHGFPGISTQQNRSIAEFVARECSRNTTVLQYQGLGHSDGVFHFRATCDEVVKAAQQMIEQSPTRKIDLVGHSWGGFLSLVVAEKCGAKIGKMLLISPLLQFLEESVCVTAWTETQANNPQIDLGNIKELAREFVEVGSENDTYQSVRHVSTETDVLILQSRTDEVTPAIEAEKRLPLFARRPVYELVETDHAFLNDRDVIQKRIAMFFGVTR